MSGVKAAAPEKLHSRFGFSAAPRYMNCAGSVQAIAALPPEPPSPHAIEGTKAHAIAAYGLKTGGRVALSGWVGLNYLAEAGVDTDGLPEPGFTVDDEMAAAVQVYLDTVWAECDRDPDHELYVETRFEFATSIGEPVWGTTDALVYHPTEGTISVFDYKHGVGVSVSAEDNMQMKGYAAAALLGREWPVAEIELVIVQPRANDVDYAGAVRRWNFEPSDLLDFASELDKQITIAVGPNPPLNAGPWCKKTFCPNRLCAAREKQALDDLGHEFNGIVVEGMQPIQGVDEIVPAMLPSVQTIDPARIPNILRGIDTLNEWAMQLNEYIRSELMAGKPVPGYKLVEKVGRRKWIESEDEIAAWATLTYDIDEDFVRPRKLVNITEMERLLKAHAEDPKAAKEEMSLRYTVKESSGLTVAHESDRRPAVNAIETDFASVDFDSFKEGMS